MSRYRMSDGTVVDTLNATRSWDEGTRWDGSNHVSILAGRHNHMRLYATRKGRWYLEHTSQWQGSIPSAEWISAEEATRWLLANEYKISDLPAELQALVEQVSE